MAATRKNSIENSWQGIQKKTFTRWCNEQLKGCDVVIDDLTTAFSDGVKLIVLLEALSMKPGKVGRYNPKPKMHVHKMENVTKALNFITKVEGIRLVNIGTSDIVTPNLKLILGLVWTLILHYQISIGFKIDSSLTSPDGGGAVRSPTPTSAKQALLEYVQSKLLNKTVRNLTTDWNDGTLIAALVDSHASGLCPEADDMDPDNALENATHAMKLASDWLGIAQLVEPQDMVNPKIDELSMMTYLSQFPDAKLKPGAPIRPRADASKVLVYGPGIEEGTLDLKAGENTWFIVDTEKSGPGALSVNCVGPAGPLSINIEDGPSGKHKCSYVPDQMGQHVISVDLNKKPVHGSPFHMDITSRLQVDNVRLTGPGLGGGKIGEPLAFQLESYDMSSGTLTVHVVKVDDLNTDVPMSITAVDKSTVALSFIPDMPGDYHLDVKINGQQVPGTPLVIPAFDTTLVTLYGSGITGQGVEIGKPADIFIDLSSSGVAPVNVTVTHPEKKSEKTVDMIPTASQPKLLRGSYIPCSPGTYKIKISLADQPIPNSPFQATIFNPSDVKLVGPGLEKATVMKDNVIHVIGAYCDAYQLSAEFKGCPVTYLVCKIKEGHHEIFYTPKRAGIAEVTVSLAGDPIQPSEVPVKCLDRGKVIMDSGSELEPVVQVGKEVSFLVDVTEAGPGSVDVRVNRKGGNDDREGEAVATNVTEQAPGGVYVASYTPVNIGEHLVTVIFDGSSQIGEEGASPTAVQSVVDIDAIKLGGAGLERGIINADNVIDVYTEGAGPGKVEVELEAPSGDRPVEFWIDGVPSNHTKIHYTPREVGVLAAMIVYAGFPVPQNRIEVPCVDPSAVTVEGEGIQSGLAAGVPVEFLVDASQAGPAVIDVAITSGGNHGEEGDDKMKMAAVEATIASQPDEPGIYRVAYVPPSVCGGEELSVAVTANGCHVPGSPFSVQVCNPDSVRAYGDGLQSAVAGAEAEFYVDASLGGTGSLSLAIEGPSECMIDCSEKDCFVYHVSYVAPLPGTYQINIKFGGRHVPGSPFQLECTRAKADASKCLVTFPDGEDADHKRFTVDAKECGGTGALEIGVWGPRAPCKFINVQHNGDYTFNVSYDLEDNQAEITIKWHGQHVPGSPFTVNILDDITSVPS